MILNQNINEYDLSKKIEKTGLQETLAYIEKNYRESNTIRDGYGMLGNIFRAKNQYKKALNLFEKDRCLEKLSPAYRHILAFVFAKLENCDAAKSEIERAHLEDPSLTCGYYLVDHQSGCLPINVEDLEKVEHQVQLGSYDSTRLINFSRILAQLERWEAASQIIAQAYAIDRNLIDGYAFLGSVLRAYAQFEDALKYYEKDNNLNRISPLSRIIYAQLLARIGMVTKAENEVQRAYEEDRGLQDGFALIGTVFRLGMQYDLALKYYEKDQKLERLSPAQRHILADQFARIGKLKEATAEAERGYQENSHLKNGFARIGNVLRTMGQIKDAKRLYDLDRKDNRLSYWHVCIYADLLASEGHYEQAICALEKEFTNQKEKKNCQISNWSTEKSDDWDNSVKVFWRDIEKSRLSLIWLQKLILFLAKAGKIKKALCVCEFVFVSYPDLKNVYTNLANCITDISPNIAKRLFERDFLSDRQTLSMTVRFLEFLLNRQLLDDAKALFVKIIKLKQNNRDSVSQIDFVNEKLGILGKRVKTLSHVIKCPAIIISFPRSGSNFLQNVISESSGLACASIYSNTGRLYPRQNLTIKSHAIDHEHLQHEIQSIRITFPPQKIIILCRDPRDVMKSLLEYVNNTRKINLSPDFFISECSFSYAAKIPAWSAGRDNCHITVSQAYKRFASCWIKEDKWKGTHVHTVFYEDLCLKPLETFATIFEFLNIKCSLNMDAIEKKVALYSQEPNRQRGVAYAWQKEGINSHAIYQLVNESFKDCIEVLGYNFDG